MSKRSTGKLFIAFVIAAAIAFVWTLTPAEADAAQKDVEWNRYQNSIENNGVVNIGSMPTKGEETALKWGKKMVSGYTTSFTPPIIVDGFLYSASDQYVYKINKETGEQVKQSEKLSVDVGHAINPITYDEDKDQFYVPIRNGRVQCLDGDTLDSKWVSDEPQQGSYQSISPITYKNGLVYTGIWQTETSDGEFFCLDADTGVIKWSYVPSLNGEKPHGFYWAGAYVTDNYVVVGSDDGTNNMFAEAADGKYTETAVVYSFDSKTGTVIDRITGIKGDIRSSIVHSNGNIYFTSKGGRLYKAAFDPSTGRFGNVSYIQMKERARDASGEYVNGEEDALMTASPVVHNGRIYVGAAGSGGQYNADGGHFFAVIRDDAVLSDSSLIYTVPIPGYPQVAPILSTATENTDGKVRLYFTFNAFPGGIYYFEDSSAATAQDPGAARKLYTPEKEMQQYCISPLCCDRDGTIYYKNDSGYLMAVNTNRAWIEDISVTSSDREIEWASAFENGRLSYDLKAPNGASSVGIRLTLPQGVTAAINGAAYSEGKMQVSLGSGTTEIPVTAKRTDGGRTWTRTYTLRVTTASNDASLSGLIINTNNNKTKDHIGYDPGFDSGIREYVARTYDGDSENINIWIDTKDPEATFKVYPVSNAAPLSSLNSDGSLPTVETFTNNRFVQVFWIKGANSAEVDIEVTSASRLAKSTYHVTLMRSDANIHIGKTPLMLSTTGVTLYTEGSNQRTAVRASYDGTDVTEKCTFRTMDPSVATVDSYGNILATGRKGETVVWVDYDEMNLSSSVKVEVAYPTLEKPTSNLMSGTYYEPVEIVLNTSAAGAQVRYVTGSPGDDIDAPSTTGGTEYSEPIKIGTEGELTEVKIRAIACGSGYSKSFPEDFVYTVDLRDGAEDPYPVSADSPGVVLGAGSVRIEDDDVNAFSDLPNGFTYESMASKLSGVRSLVTITNGSTEESVATEIDWNVTEGYPYDPDSAARQSFVLTGRARLPENVKARGNTMLVSLPVTIRQAVIPKPTASPAAGTYKADQKITLTSSVKGASIYYTVTGVSGTQSYSETGPIPLTAAANVRKAYTINAYALKNGVKSDTATFNYTIDKVRINPPAAPTGLTATVNTANRTIAVKWNASATATSYRVAYKHGTARTWSYKIVKTRNATLSGFGMGGFYQIMVAPINAGGQGKYTAAKYCLMAKNVMRLTGGKRSFTYSINKLSSASGYQIRYGVNRNLSGARTIKTTMIKRNVTSLIANRVYYVQVTPYRVYAGKVYYGQPLLGSVRTK